MCAAIRVATPDDPAVRDRQCGRDEALTGRCPASTLDKRKIIMSKSRQQKKLQTPKYSYPAEYSSPKTTPGNPVWGFVILIILGVLAFG